AKEDNKDNQLARYTFIGGNQSGEGGEGHSAKETSDRRFLVHQEAVAGLVENYAASVARLLADLAAVHEVLHAGLVQAGDLVEDSWADRVGAMAKELRSHASAATEDMKQSCMPVSQARQRHRETVRLSLDSDMAMRRLHHYQDKVEILRAQAAEARGGLKAGAVDPNAESSGALPKRSFSGLKTMQADLKLGKLWRNEEKLEQMTQQANAARAVAAKSMSECLTQVRQRLHSSLADVLHLVIDMVLPGLQPPLSAGVPSASQNRETGSRTAKVSAALCAFAEGERILVDGLSGSAQYNGCAGTVQGLRADGRVEVELDDELLDASSPNTKPKVLALKPENLPRNPNAPRCSKLSPAFLNTGSELLGLCDQEAHFNKAEDSSGED
ncbi:unnamed protein product, partial [Polarella glacialis]